MKQYSCIIIGAGSAALQAALFLGRAKISTLVIGQPEKSDLAMGRVIGNYFGLADEPTGKLLLDHGVQQIKKYGVELVTQEVVSVERQNDQQSGFTIQTEKGKEYSAPHIIIATGIARVKTHIKGEEEFWGKGVQTCVACDGPLFKQKQVGFVGSGSHVAQEAVEMTTYTDRITIFTLGKEPNWSRRMSKLIKSHKITVDDRRLKEFKGGMTLQSIVFGDDTEEPYDGLFIAIGAASSVTFANKLGLVLKDNYIVIDEHGRTNSTGVWAAGSVTGAYPQIATSVGQGCNAAIGVIKTVKGIDQYSDQT